MVPIYSIHNDPQHYPNPHVFDPERFSNENGGLKQYKDKCVYLAFGDGPRICLGNVSFETIILKKKKFIKMNVNCTFRNEICYDST